MGEWRIEKGEVKLEAESTWDTVAVVQVRARARCGSDGEKRM